MSREMSPDADRSPSESTRGGRRTTQTGRRRFSLPFLVAGVVIVAGAAFLFNPPGNDVPVGIGQQISILTTEPVISATHDAPSSGPVDIDDELSALVPEKTTPGAPAAPPLESPSTETTATNEPVTVDAPRPSPASPAISAPAAAGSWAAQYGAFGQQENADRLMEKLRGAGYTPYLRTVNNSQGTLIYRVWIGFFTSREDAGAFAEAQKSTLGEALITKR